MLEIGIRELKNQTSRIIRAVREDRVEYVVTVHGRPVAVLRPFDDADAQRLRRAALAESMAEMQDLAQKIAAAWRSPKTGVELVAEQRR